MIQCNFGISAQFIPSQRIYSYPFTDKHETFSTDSLLSVMNLKRHGITRKPHITRLQ